MATSTEPKAQMISITTSDGITMDVERPVAERSILIKNLLEDLGGESTESIPIPNVCLTLSLTSKNSR
jgi:S-phase kinase-associated protein 1